MINVGDTAPDFELPDAQGEIVRLGDALENGRTIVYFYPADFTPVCTAEACAFRDEYEGLEEIGVQIIGISPQSVDSHERFTERHSIPFPLLADTRKKVIRAYGVDGPFGVGVRRATYLVETDGTVSNRVVSDFFVGSHMELVKETLQD